MVEQEAELRTRLHELEIEHRDLDEVIDRLSNDISIDQLRLSRMKKRKLLIKDQIERIQSQIIPNILA